MTLTRNLRYVLPQTTLFDPDIAILQECRHPLAGKPSNLAPHDGQSDRASQHVSTQCHVVLPVCQAARSCGLWLRYCSIGHDVRYPNAEANNVLGHAIRPAATRSI